MRKLGEGWQYTVYDLGNGRVLKKFHSWPRAFWVILKTIFPFRDDSAWVIPRYVKGMKEKALTSIKILQETNIPGSWIGNAVFINDLDFEQDKTEPLSDVFKRLGVEESKRIINAFIKFNRRFLSAGLIDKSFNITKNFGLSGEHDIVLIDLGEVFKDPLKVERQRRSRAWSAHYVAGCIESEEVRNYFIHEMDKNFGL